MPPRDPERPQLDFPQLTADIIEELRIRGQIGLLNFLDEVRPVYIVASRGGSLDVVTRPPLFTSAGTIGGSATNPLVNVIILDTGQLAAGDYDIFAIIHSVGTMNVTGNVRMQHRNAANSANLRNLLQIGMTTTHQAGTVVLPLMGYVFAENERMRMEVVGGTVTGTITMTMGFQLRPTP